MMLFASFALLALALGTVGVYSVVAHSVVQRFREIGVRRALGASKHDVLKMVLKEGLGLAAVGVAIGLLSALVTSRVMSSLLYVIKPYDWVTFLAVLVLMVCVALVACYIPARRATKVDPMVALRYE